MARRPAALVLLAAAAALLVPAAAPAAVPFADIASRGPLTHVYVGSELSCQVAFRGDRRFQLYPPREAPGDCGTFLAVEGRLFGPDFANHRTSATRNQLTATPFAALSQSGVLGSGSRGSPLRVVTEVGLPGTAVRILQTDSYVVGDLTYRTDLQLVNDGPALAGAILYRAGDCYLQGSDEGYGFVRFGKSIGCARNADNQPPARVEQWVPITRQGASFFEARYTELWHRIDARQPFPDRCRCTRNIDNGAGISWALDLPAASSLRRAHFTTFSRNGVSGTPGSDDTTPPELYVSARGAPLGTRCVPPRFRLRVHVLDASRLEHVTARLDGRRVLSTRRSLSKLVVEVAPERGASHRLTVAAADRRGNDVRRTIRFAVCG